MLGFSVRRARSTRKGKPDRRRVFDDVDVKKDGRRPAVAES
ncbi:hypothetical protein HMPREF9440_00191 [Sutterella parvirubra YIT 11816]|uniref:Uncharacterized protein n=1 Tax=Sutterella parvirubra YIT 11816 TaxID=762967 RepID=H3KBU5_9BURK|nr:hypothetical protein HMPREF9440_00191 [Sutterella parvirubra YIT 11816]